MQTPPDFGSSNVRHAYVLAPLRHRQKTAAIVPLEVALHNQSLSQKIKPRMHTYIHKQTRTARVLQRAMNDDTWNNVPKRKLLRGKARVKIKLDLTRRCVWIVNTAPILGTRRHPFKLGSACVWDGITWGRENFVLSYHTIHITEVHNK